MQTLFQDYTDGVSDNDDNGVGVLQTVALKSECNFTVSQFKACRRFAAQNKIKTDLFLPYKKVLKAEEELDCGNVEYDVLKAGVVIRHH